jgi:transcriptional regulator with XRE-family HTH domain
MVGLKMPIGDQVKRLRAAAGLTQQALAIRAEMSISAVVHIESGRIPNPRLETLRKLAKALDVSLDELAGDEDSGEAEEPKKPKRRK